MDRFLGHLRLFLLALLIGVVCAVGLVAWTGYGGLLWVGATAGFAATIVLPLWARRRWQRAKAWREARDHAPTRIGASRVLRALDDVQRRTPAQRCPDELMALFVPRFEERFPAGVPADDLAGAREIAEACVDDLARYSRALGKNGETPDLAAISQLPADLIPDREELAELRSRVAAAPCALAADALLDLWPSKNGAQPGRAESVLYIQLLAKLGVGVEPDVRFGGPRWKPGMQLQLFRLPPVVLQSPSRDYTAAVLVVQLAVAVSAADGEISAPEEEALRAALGETLDLNPEERQRLEAHVTWRLANPPRTLGLQRRAESMTAEEQARIAAFLIRVACADGRIDPGEVRILERAYRLLDLDPARVHSDLHAAASGGSGASALDPARVAEMRAETARVSTLLASIFVEDEKDPEPAEKPPESPISGLNAPHAAFLAALTERPEWPREDLEDLATRFSLLPDGALETLNELAFDETGDPLWEGDDPIEIDPDVAEALAPPFPD